MGAVAPHVYAQTGGISPSTPSSGASATAPDPFDAGNANPTSPTYDVWGYTSTDPFDAGNMDPNNPIYDYNSNTNLSDGQTATTIPSPSDNSTVSCFVKIDSLSTLLGIATCFLTIGIIPMLVTFAIIAFIWGVITYVIGKGDPKVLEKGRWYMVWGIVALFVMISVWGLVKVLGNTFGINAVLPLLPE